MTRNWWQEPHPDLMERDEMSDLRRNKNWAFGLTPEEAAEVIEIDARCAALDGERRELTARRNRFIQRASQRLLSKRRRGEAA
jgi:hypothetical protein